MNIYAPLCTCALVLTSCSLVGPTTSELPFFGDGYRADGDQCRRIGENNYTNQFLDDSSDLVGCPADYEGLGVFIGETGAFQVAESGEFILYSVPIR